MEYIFSLDAYTTTWIAMILFPAGAGLTIMLYDRYRTAHLTRNHS